MRAVSISVIIIGLLIGSGVYAGTVIVQAAHAAAIVKSKSNITNNRTEKVQKHKQKTDTNSGQSAGRRRHED